MFSLRILPPSGTVRQHTANERTHHRSNEWAKIEQTKGRASLTRVEDVAKRPASYGQCRARTKSLDGAHDKEDPGVAGERSKERAKDEDDIGAEVDGSTAVVVAERRPKDGLYFVRRLRKCNGGMLGGARRDYRLFLSRVLYFLCGESVAYHNSHEEDIDGYYNEEYKSG